MKKFISVFVAVALCLCVCASTAFAAKSDDIGALLEGVDVGSLTDGELASILGSLDLDGMDVSKIKDSLSGSVKNLDADTGSDSAPSDAAGGVLGGDVLGGLTDLLGGIDLSSITGMISDPSAITDMFSGLLGDSGEGGSGIAGSDFDLNGLMDTISGAFSGEGFDLAALTEGFDMGSFDFASILGGLGDLTGGLGGGATGGDAAGDGSTGGDSAGATDGGIMDKMAGIMDGLTGGLAGLGLDTSAIEGLLDNELVNFFANMYIGLGEVVKPEKPTEPSTTKAPDVTKKPPVVTTQPPKTGDTPAVFVALGTISIAAAAAFVCLKKKKD